MTTLKKILVATDLSDESISAMAAAKQAAAWSGASVTLVHVFDPMPMVPPIALAPGYTIGEDVLSEIRENIQKGLEHLRAEHFGGGATTELKMIEGSNPSHAICSFAKEGGYDLVVIGTHGRRGASRLLLGSVAERVVREAPCSVWVAR
ncbi:MAG: universal stress protein [Polyangiales bacterium]